jgi:mono/diheme cytochrome c family protein
VKSFFKIKCFVLAAITGLVAAGIAGGANPPPPSPPAPASGVSGAVAPLKILPAVALASQGYQIFQFNCAHCHGTDARGDEGPDLHGVGKSDQQIARLIQNGIKGEMPRFGAKLNDADTQALIAFIRTLKNE